MTSGVLRFGFGVDLETSQKSDAFSDEAEDLDQAVNGLRRICPQFSASFGPAGWQIIAAVSIAAFVPISMTFAFLGRVEWFAALLTVPFALIILIRCAALCFLMTPRRAVTAPLLPDDMLPTYSVFVPLFKEREVVPALVEALRALDYPLDKLEIIFITEANDAPTRAALTRSHLNRCMRVLTVPGGQPQTKPRALNYALQFASGELIAVYDAEDVPSPRQLRLAAEQFAVAAPEVACLQARLGTYNPDAGFLTRQFTLEYASLFEAILPALERLGLPILLGGTSNHFRRSLLIDSGAWDPFNVTEDADLGVRFVRLGRRVQMLDSDTWEEAPGTRKDWYGQRTRWLKGWLQTYAVHMRDPWLLLCQLGFWRFAGLQALLGGTILSALVHPLFYVAALFHLWFEHAVFSTGGSMWAICWFNLVAGYAVGILLGLIAAWRSQGRVPLFSALFVPVYWLAISVASYRAVFEFYLRPFHWEKTPHAARPVTISPVAT